MPPPTRPVAELLRGRVEQLATPSNFRYGTAIYERGGVEFIELGSHCVTAWVGGLDGTSKTGGGQRRRTRISSTESGLSWRCTGNPKDHEVFCKHCVALALALAGMETSAPADLASPAPPAGT